MRFVITLLANPDKTPLTQAFVESMTPSLGLQHIRVEKTRWLKGGEACELYAEHASPAALEAHVQTVLADQPYDAIVQPDPKPRYRLFVADMESTVIENECLDELAEYVGARGKIEAITARAMNGELDFAEALAERVALLKGLPEQALEEVYEKKVKLTGGAKELLAAMKKSGAYCMLVSGGFDFFAQRIKSRLRFDEQRSNRLEIAFPPLAGGLRGEAIQSRPPLTPPASGGGKILTGRVLPPVLDKHSKLAALKEACQKLNVAPEKTLAVGDGANDLPMLLEAGLGVAYHAKPSVRAQAKARLNHCDLSALMWVQGENLQN